MDTAQIINDYTMIISSKEMNRELCMIGISTKIYPEKTSSGDFIIGCTRFLFDVGLMLHPNTSFTNYQHNISFDDLIKDYRKDHFLVQKQEKCTVSSIYGKQLLVTLKKESQYFEFICDSVSQNKMLFKNKTNYDVFNQLTCEELCLNYTKCNEKGNTYFIDLTNYFEIFSIEVLGYRHSDNICVGGSWFPDGERTDLGGTIDYDNKSIEAVIIRSEDTGRGRRTSNGWISYYNEYRADLIRLFNTRRDIEIFWKELKEQHKEIEIRIDKHDNSAFWHITFPVTVKEEDIIHLMRFSVFGSSWKEEW